MRETLAQLVTRRIKELDTSKAAVAKAVGISRSYIGNIANQTAPTQSGQYNLSPDTVSKLAKVLEIPETQILAAMNYLPDEAEQSPIDKDLEQINDLYNSLKTPEYQDRAKKLFQMTRREIEHLAEEERQQKLGNNVTVRKDGSFSMEIDENNTPREAH